MRLKKSTYLKLFFLAAVSTSAVAANAPSTIAAMHCAPAKSTVKAALAKMPLLKSWDYDYYYYVYHYDEYDASKQKPFGLKAKKVQTEAELDNVSSYLKVRTTLDSNYDIAKKAVLKAFKQSACKSETGKANSRTCYLNVPADATARLSDIYVTEKSATEVEFYCKYK